MTHSPQDSVDLTDPAISPHRLQELAQTHPNLWDEILTHPNVYPGLADWIRDRQQEQAAAFEADDTMVFGAVETTEAETSSVDHDDDVPAESDPEAVEEDIDAADAPSDPAAADYDPAEESATPSWATPEPNAPQRTDQAPSTSDRIGWTQDPSQPQAPGSQTSQGEPIWGWPGTGSSAASQQPQHQQPPHQESQQQAQQHYQAPAAGYGQQPPYGQQQQQQPPYGYGQHYGQPAYGQQFQPRPARQRTPIDLNSAGTWGLFVAGGAAFMTLFGYFFSPTLSGFGMPTSSHVASGGWMILLLFLATVTLSILQLVKPSAWLRYFLIVVSFGAAFTMIGRTTALIGFFTMQNTSFSVIWMLFMSLVLLAGIMVYIAPKAADSNGQSGNQGQQPAPQQQQFGYQPAPMQQPGYGHHPGNPPYGGYGQQPGGYPSGPQH